MQGATPIGSRIVEDNVTLLLLAVATPTPIIKRRLSPKETCDIFSASLTDGDSGFWSIYDHI